MDDSTDELRINRVPLPYFFLSVSVSLGMHTGSNYQMVDVEIWLLFPSRGKSEKDTLLMETLSLDRMIYSN